MNIFQIAAELIRCNNDYVRGVDQRVACGYVDPITRELDANYRRIQKQAELINPK
jgi:hypothetical protein